jgi:hypothetical protein
LDDAGHERDRSRYQGNRGPKERKVRESAYTKQKDSHDDADWPFDSTHVAGHDITSMHGPRDDTIDLHLLSASSMPGGSNKNSQPTKHLEDTGCWELSG